MEHAQNKPSSIFEWKELHQKNDCSLPARYRHCSILYKGNLLIIGGQQNDGKCPEEILMFNLDNYVWTAVELLNGPLYAKFGFTACTFENDKIVIYGGIHKDHGGYVDKLDILVSCNSKEFTLEKKEIHLNCSNLNRAYHTANVYQDKMYIFGGQTSPQNEDNSLYIFDLKSFSMTHCSPNGELPEARSQHCSALYNGKLYIYSGYYTAKGSWGYCESYLDDLWCLDIGNMMWQKLRINGISPGNRKGATMQYFENKLFIFGGSDDKTNFNSLICYDIEKEQGQMIGTSGQLPQSRPYQSSILFKNTMIVFGGVNSESAVYSIKLGIFPSIIILKKLGNELNLDAEEKKCMDKVAEEKQEPKEPISSNLKKDLKRFFVERPYPDITFSVQGQEIPAHRGFLVVRCPHFGKLFENKDENGNVKISNLKPEIFNKLLEYVYCDEVKIDSDEEAIDLVIVSLEFSLEELTKLCENFLVNHIKVENAIDLSILAEKLKSNELRRGVIEFIMQHKETVYKREEFSHIPKSFLLEILKRE